MLSDKIIISEPFIWAFSINEGKKVIQISKVSHQQYFLTGDDPEALVEYYKQINEDEVRRIDRISKTSPFTSLDNMDLLVINLN